MADFYLPRNVYFCSKGESLIFLDLTADRYVKLHGSQAEDFRRLCACVNTSEMATEHSVELANNIDTFLTSGLLTTDKAAGKPLTPTEFALPDSVLVSSVADQSVRIRPLQVFRFFISCSIAAARLRFGTIEGTVRAIEKRKRSRVAQHVIDTKRAREVVSVFNRLRALFPATYLCLFDSLALIEFLARHDLFPTWVFGVQFEPWAAHCWVQAESIAFNEGVEEAEDYIPIMTI
nr:hypothetical protein Hi04_10k_c4921_00004 [uncultured bacterium]